MKIPEKGIVRKYELTYLLSVSYTETELQGFRADVDKMLTKHGATVDSTEEWGKKELAYEIKFKHQPQNEAVYVHVLFSAKPAAIKAIESGLKLNPSLMRYLLVTAEDEKAIARAEKALVKAKAAASKRVEEASEAPEADEFAE
jgi:small subunit ribosomal protein S6